MTAPTVTHVPAAAGWYARPGDPVGVVRRWTGDCWAYQVHGGDAQRAMEQLRLIPEEHRSPAEHDQLVRAVREVSRIEELVMGAERQSPPLVAMPQAYPYPAAPPASYPYSAVPPQAYPYAAAASQPYPQSYAPQLPSQQPYAPRPQMRPSPRTSRPGRGTLWVRVGVGIVSALVMIVIKVVLPMQAGGTSTTSLRVGDCLTMSAPLVSTSSDAATWRAGSCETAKNGPVSYLVVAVVPKSPGCADVYTYVYKGSTAFCLVENLAVGSCARWDAKDFMFDVECTDTRAEIKVVQRVEKGSGVPCGRNQEALEYPLPGRTYCLAKP